MSFLKSEKEPLLSIVVPVYKTEAYLCECIESLLSQTLNNIEIILVDDGSPDGSGMLCDKYARQDSRISVIHKENEGLLKARISGVSCANGQYIGFVDSDDKVAPDYFEKLYKAATQNNADLVYCSLTFLYEDCFEEKLKIAKIGFSGVFEGNEIREKIYPYLLYDYSLSSSEKIPGFMVTKLYSKKLLKEAFGKVPKEIHIYEDVAVSFYCGLKAKKVAFIPESSGYLYRQRADSILHSFRLDYFEDVRSLLLFLDETISHFKVEKELGTTFKRYATGRALRMQASVAYSKASCRYLWAVAKELMISSLWLSDDALDFFNSQKGNGVMRKIEILICRKRARFLCLLLMLIRHSRFLLKSCGSSRA